MYSFDPIQDIKCRLICLRCSNFAMGHEVHGGNVIVYRDRWEIYPQGGEVIKRSWKGLSDDDYVKYFGWVLHNGNVVTFNGMPELFDMFVPKHWQSYKIILSADELEDIWMPRDQYCIAVSSDQHFSVLLGHILDDVRDEIKDSVRYLGYSGTFKTVSIRDNFTHVMPDYLFERVSLTIGSPYTNIAELFSTDTKGAEHVEQLLCSLKNIDPTLIDKLEAQLGSCNTTAE